MGVVPLTLLLGVLPAWLVTMYRFPGSKLLQWMFFLPITLPAYVIGYIFTGLFDVGGPIQQGIRTLFDLQVGEYWFPEIRSLPGAIVVFALAFYPYVYLFARAAFLEQSVCALEVGRMFGSGAGRLFFRVGLPLARPYLVVGVALVLMETFADYGTVQYFGVDTLIIGIFRVWFGFGDSRTAAQLSTVLLSIIFILFVIERLSRRKARYHNTTASYRVIHRSSIHGYKLWLSYAVCLFPLVGGFLIPFIFLVIWSVQTMVTVDWADFMHLVFNSLLLAGLGASLVLGIAIFFSYMRYLYPSKMVRWGVHVATMGYALPGAIIAIGILLLLSTVQQLDWFDAYILFSDHAFLSGLLLLLFAYLVRYLFVGLNAVDAGLSKITPAVKDASRIFGLSVLKKLWLVDMPIMRGSITAGFLLAFVDVLKELPATLLLRPFNFNTLAIRSYELANNEMLYHAALPALVIVLFGIVSVVLLNTLLSSYRSRYDLT